MSKRRTRLSAILRHCLVLVTGFLPWGAIPVAQAAGACTSNCQATTCSTNDAYKTAIRINEAKSQGGGIGLDFIEIFVMQNGVPIKPSGANSWTIGVSGCTGGGCSNSNTATLTLDGTDRGCINYTGTKNGFNSCSNAVSASSILNYPGYVDYNLPNMSQSGGQFVLFDPEGKVVDMVNFSSSSTPFAGYWSTPTGGSCSGNLLNFSSSSADFQRTVDGTGGWCTTGSGAPCPSSPTQGTTNLSGGGSTPVNGLGYKFQYSSSCIGSTPNLVVTAEWVDSSGNFISPATTYTAYDGTGFSITQNPANSVTVGTWSSGVGTYAIDTSKAAAGTTLTLTGVNSNLPGTSSSGSISVPSCAASLDHYAITTTTTQVANCDYLDVTVTGHSSTGSTVSIPSGTAVTLSSIYQSGSTSGNKGDWTTTLVSGAGTLNNGTVDDGAAVVTTSAAQTSFTVRLQNTWSQTVKLTASSTGATGTPAAGEQPIITFSPAVLRFVDVNSNTISSLAPVAGVSSSTVYLQAINSTQCSGGACTGQCTGLFPPATTTSVNLAYECVAPTACQSGQSLVLDSNGTDTALAANNGGSTISYVTTPLYFRASNGGGPSYAAPFFLNYSDVGTLRLWASYTATGISSTVSSASFLVKPYDFGVAGAVTSSCSSFVYLGQSGAIQPSASNHVVAKALNASGAITPNYRSGYAATLATATLAAVNDSGGSITLDATVPSCTTGNWTTTGCDLGTGWATALNRASSSVPVVPYTAHFKVRISDPNSDVAACASAGGGCLKDGTPALGALEGRYGRLRLANAFGTEQLPLLVLGQLEYYSVSGGVGTWPINIDDFCTALTPAATSLTLSGGTGAGTTTLTFASPAVKGSLNLSLSKPTGGTGWVDIGFPGTPAYLQIPNMPNNTSARATFGIQNTSNTRIIYRRERY